jgi:hypothetical protein
MSQHHILTNQYEILIGWDRPLQYFFGTVWDKTHLDNEEMGIVFATISLPEGGVGTVAELARLLQPYVELPPHIVAALSEDERRDRGNAVYEWKLEGSGWNIASTDID